MASAPTITIVEILTVKSPLSGLTALFICYLQSGGHELILINRGELGRVVASTITAILLATAGVAIPGRAQTRLGPLSAPEERVLKPKDIFVSATSAPKWWRPRPGYHHGLAG
jgi:hypothetical protein